MRYIILFFSLLAALIANCNDSLTFNFETENNLVSNSNLSVLAKTDKEKFLNIYLSTIYDNIPVAINDISITGECAFSIALQQKGGAYYLQVEQKNLQTKQGCEQQRQWLFQLNFPEYCKKADSVFIENGITGNSSLEILQPSFNSSLFSNTSQIPSIIFLLCEKQEEKDLTTQVSFENTQAIYGISNKLLTPLTAQEFSSIFKDKKFSFEVNLCWDPSKDTSFTTCTINDDSSLFYKIDKENSVLIWLDSSVPMINRQTRQTDILLGENRFVKEKTTFKIPYLTINMQKLSGPTRYFISPIPGQFCSYAPKLELSVQIIRYEKQK